jgi:hypothetical protein
MMDLTSHAALQGGIALILSLMMVFLHRNFNAIVSLP